MHNNHGGVFLDADDRPRFPDGTTVIAAAPAPRADAGTNHDPADLSWGRRPTRPHETPEAK